VTARAVYFGCLGEVGHYLHHDDVLDPLRASY